MAIFSWDNYVDDATVTDSTNSISPHPGTQTIAGTKLQTRQLSDVARYTFTSTASPLPDLIYDFDLASAKTTDLIAILGYSSNLAGKSFTLAFGTSSGASDVGTETGTLWNGGEINPRYNHFVYLTSGHSARYVRLSVHAVAASVVDIGRVWLNDAYSAQFSMDFNISIKDPSSFTKSRGGSAYASAKNMPRMLSCKAFGLTNNDFTGNPGLLAMHQAIGTHDEVIILPLTDTSQNLHRLGVYGHIKSNQGIHVISKSGTAHVTDNRFVVEEDF